MVLEAGQACSKAQTSLGYKYGSISSDSPFYSVEYGHNFSTTDSQAI